MVKICSMLTADVYKDGVMRKVIQSVRYATK